MTPLGPAGAAATSTEVVRDINRRLVLNLIRTRQPLSRADLARVSGLQRSTVSLIVGQLLDERWILEGAAGHIPRGRRPTFLRLNDDRVIIGVDIRPVQTMVALADVNGQFTVQRVLPTLRDPVAAVRAIARGIRPLLHHARGKKIEGIGVTLPGRYDLDADELTFAPNLSWTGAALRAPLAKASGLDVVLDNAANACVLSAVWFDHAAAAQNLVVITVSEGIGAGVLMNGQLIRGFGGMAGEFGHVSIDPAGPRCACGNRGCWRSSRRIARRCGTPVDEVRGRFGPFRNLLSRADHGDVRATRAIERMAGYLGRGLRMVVAGLAPERVLVIGDLTRSWHRFAPAIDAELRAHAWPAARLPKLVPVHEDGLARLRGAVALVLQKHFGGAT